MDSLFSCSRNPTHDDNPVAGYQPSECFNIHTLVVANEGVRVDRNILKTNMEFWDRLERQAAGHIALEIKPVNETAPVESKKKNSKRNDDKF